MRKKWFFAVCVAVAAMLAVSGCSLFRSPQKKPDQQQQQQKKGAQGAEPQITVYMHETGEKKTMQMEEYIAGVVAGEMKPDWPVEALAAQAIVARTFTLEEIESKGGVPARGTQASTDIKEFQAYSAKDVNDNVRKAVEMTRGMVATYQGKPIRTWFHASAGGITATAKEGLNFRDDEPPYIQSVESPDDLAPPEVKNWTVSFPKREVIAAVDKIGQKLTAVESAEIGEKGPSGRATSLVFNKTVRVSAPDFRVQIGSMGLKSMLLDSVTVEGDKVTFAGRGYGHGVGMSQWGAHKMAKDGKRPEDIVKHYFKDIAIEKKWQ